MADHPARRGLDPAGEDVGWGSPMPAEYGSLTAFLPPLDDHPVDETPATERRASGRQTAPRDRTPRRWRSRRGAPAPDATPPVVEPAPSPNGSARSWADPTPTARTGGGRDAGVPGTSNGPARSWPNPAPPAENASAPAARSGSGLAGPTAPPSRPGTRPGRPGPGVPKVDGVAVVPVAVPAEGRGPAPGAPAPAASESTEEPTPSEVPELKRKRRSRAQWGQSTRTVRHLNVWTVAKVSFIFYLLFFGAVVVASVMLWYVANAVGAIQSIEKSVRTLFDLKEFTLHPSQVAAYTSAGGGVLAIVGTLGNILAALMYNLISDLVGGIRFQVVDEVK